MRISLIAAMASNRVIGRDNQLPWHLPEDLKRFKSLTLGHPVIMGRKTFESIGRPLSGRRNIVISRNPPVRTEAGEPVFARSIEEALKIAAATGTDEAFVIGGAEIYSLALPAANRLYLTLIEGAVEGDAFFPSWEAFDFREVERQDRDEPRRFSFVTLERS